jgi:hypothetical protein
MKPEERRKSNLPIRGEGNNPLAGTGRGRQGVIDDGEEMLCKECCEKMVMMLRKNANDEKAGSLFQAGTRF